MTRGEGPDFTARAARWLERWGASEALRSHHERLARHFEHMRAFLKVEWHPRDEGWERLVACYYRRRPPLAEAIGVVGEALEAGDDLDCFKVLARTLGKATVHFVASAGGRAPGLHHKLYFSAVRHARQPRRGADAARPRNPPLRGRTRRAGARWAGYRDVLCPRSRVQTVFVSINHAPQPGYPSLKIDYPDVAPVAAVGVLDEERQEPVERRLRDLCELAGREDLSYLGVRMAAGPVPTLKGYADFP